MTTASLLRVASIIFVLFAAGHTLGGRKDWSPMGETEVLKAMRTDRFEVLGVSRTYLDFYRGFGYMLSVDLLLQAFLLWQMAGIAKTNPRPLRPMIAAFALASFVGVFLALRFIFPIPAAFSAALTLCLALAFFKAR